MLCRYLLYMHIIFILLIKIATIYHFTGSEVNVWNVCKVFYERIAHISGYQHSYTLVWYYFHTPYSRSKHHSGCYMSVVWVCCVCLFYILKSFVNVSFVSSSWVYQQFLQCKHRGSRRACVPLHSYKNINNKIILYNCSFYGQNYFALYSSRQVILIPLY